MADKKRDFYDWCIVVGYTGMLGGAALIFLASRGFAGVPNEAIAVAGGWLIASGMLATAIFIVGGLISAALSKPGSQVPTDQPGS